MKNIIYLIAIFFSLQGFSQKNEFTPEVEELIDQTAKLYSENEYKEYDKLSQEFGKLMGETSYRPSEHIFADWIKEHLSETNFKSVEQAVDLENKMSTAFAKHQGKADILSKKMFILASESDDSEKFIKNFKDEFEKRIDQRLAEEKNK